MSAVICSFAVAYRKARHVQLLPRTLCSCGCARTVTRLSRVCMYRVPGTGEERVYATRACLFAHVGGVK